MEKFINSEAKGEVEVDKMYVEPEIFEFMEEDLTENCLAMWASVTPF